MNSTGSSDTSRLFASLYMVSKEVVTKIPFATVEEFCNLEDNTILPVADTFVILLLQGYPSPEWLSAVGSKFHLNPEFFLRHIFFNIRPVAGHALNSRRTATEILPSRHGWMTSLLTPNIIAEAPQFVNQLEVTEIFGLRREVEDIMARYLDDIAHLKSNLKGGSSVVRDVTIYPYETTVISLEQSLTIAVHHLGNSWMGMCHFEPG